jgi:DNA-binding PadR family transcriptional regulator
MTEQAFFVLTALVGEPLHGYSILNSVSELSGGRVRPRVGTLYGGLDRLAAQGAVELDREEVVKGRFRRYYRLTDDGRRELSREVARQAANATTAGERLAKWAAERGDGISTAMTGRAI